MKKSKYRIRVDQESGIGKNIGRITMHTHVIKHLFYSRLHLSSLKYFKHIPKNWHDLSRSVFDSLP